ncbi:SusC/RagA family TonB-linked outer membrane protein [Arcticibacterium luteifluviistationis]|uniref:SusC/RagA family TonB-linked outer membrane protein n=1 Tax=Arcticibacterium luteifluviistationis TaxID=1784714 RepID=A0A2Z4GD68_9BACT|nr:TonB-dependent receptor [Arcticibacterium luteifluviistationis]AWV99262.1 SusC/RagA family TonB-linked outer membrane protein [Arcticibacterium luteifluviistationis]
MKKIRLSSTAGSFKTRVWQFTLASSSVVLLFLLASLQSVAQVTGTVGGDDTPELPGVSVVVKGTTIGTTTDINGKYSIAAPSNSTLTFSFVGYLPQEVVVGNQSVINVTLNTDAAALEEVVVVGYGTVRKSQLTGAISTVKAKDITDLPIENTQQALQGRIAGVDVMQAGSKPGTEPRVVIRGRRSFGASNDPLYVLDGIPLATGTGDINPNDIASMEVLKDASATAIYGARGANGVVLITSKRGTKGKPVVYYDAYFGVSKAHDIIDLMDGDQFANTKREAYRQADGTIPNDDLIFTAVELESIALGRSTDYLDDMLQTGTKMNHQIGFAGGNDRSQFYMSLNYYKDNGIIPNQDYNRNVLRVNLDHQVTKNIKIGLSSFMNYSIRNGENFNPLGGAYRENPLGQPYNEDGTLNFLPTEDGLRSNPFSELVDGAVVNQRKSNRIFAGIYAEWDILKNLKYRFNFGPDIRNDKYDNFLGTFTNAVRLGPPRASTLNTDVFNYTVENILSYDKELLGNHKLNITGVQSLQRDHTEFNSVSVEGIPSETQQYNSVGTATTILGVESGLSEWTILSYMARVNYGINDKYLLTASMRADGASRFGANTKWGYFPAVAVAWNMSEESFIKNIPAIDLMKFRVSYGSIGNQGIDPYQTQGLLTQTAYNFGNNAAFGYAPGTIGNPDLKWETSTTANVGLDFSLFSGRVYGSLEYYNTNTSDLLLSRNLPTSTGFSLVTTNVGKTRNSGFEGTISTVNVSKSNSFKWSTDFTFFTNKEEIVELANGKVDDVGNGWFIGQPLSVIYDYEQQGIWQTNEADLAASYGGVPGEVRIVDQNNDGAINSDDRVIQGSGVPKFSGGITNRLKYKNWDFSAFVYARLGQTIRSSFHTSYNTLFGRYNNIDVDYWTPTNPVNTFPKPNQNQESPKWNSSLNIFDGSFVKVRNINLGYNFAEAAAKKLGMQSLRLYTSIQQPFIFSSFISKYSGSDPETDFDASLSGNVTPSTWSATFGLNVKF